MKLKTEKIILSSDDSEFFRIKVSDILKNVGYRVISVSDDKKIILKLSSQASEIDLLILDIQLPHIDGFEVLKWIREHNLEGKLQVLVVTGAYEQTKVLTELKKLGATGLITKASTPEQLLYKVNNLVFSTTSDPRIALRTPSATPVDVTHSDRTFTGYILNLSETGAFIHYIHYKRENPPKKGYILSLRFSFLGENKVIECDAKVVWADETENNKDNLLFKGFGVHFIKIQPEDRSLIAKYVKSELEKLG